MPHVSFLLSPRRLPVLLTAGLAAISFIAAAPRKPAPTPVPKPVRKAPTVPPAEIPHFDSNEVAWIAINSDFTPVPGSPEPVAYDPKYPFRRNDEPGPATYRVANLDNPNLKPWVKEALRQSNELVFQGKVGATPRWSCLPGGVPGFSLFVVEPVYIVQGPKEVLLIYSGNHEVRHVYLDVSHSKSVKPSWYGESIGRYEGDTLVIDTIGISQKAVIDNYHTPHTDALHVVERWHLIDDGKTLETDLLVDDPGAFYAPWKAVQHYRRVTDRGTLPEENCSENNDNIFHLPGWVPSPEAGKPDF
jgi:hypothetical protein